VNSYGFTEPKGGHDEDEQGLKTHLKTAPWYCSSKLPYHDLNHPYAWLPPASDERPPIQPISLVHTWRSVIREVVFKKLKFQQIPFQSRTKATPCRGADMNRGMQAVQSLDAASSSTPVRDSYAQWLVYFIHCSTVPSLGAYCLQLGRKTRKVVQQSHTRLILQSCI
jgi:hypothetical protein